MRPAFPASDYYEGSATRPALAEGWPTPLPESRTCFPSSTRLHLHAVLGPACTPGTARCRARHRRMPIKGSTASLPEQGCLCKEETEIPMTPPSPYRERVVRGATLQSAVPFVTITALWLAARGVVGWPPPHCLGKASDTTPPLALAPASLATGLLLAGFHTWNVQPMRFLAHLP